jgi:diadenosine tetraphosphate (Ap4A) HIT family hydrolase
VEVHPRTDGVSQEASCPFCSAGETILRNELAYLRFDRNPVTAGHCLIIPFRHVPDFFATTDEEQRAMLALAGEAKRMLDRDFSPHGYNLGINVGEPAGQTVFHVHLHLIPRYRGDVANPRGGVRGVIPARQTY